MANYLMKYKSKYRILPELDTENNDFAVDCRGDKDEDGIYIACRNDCKISFWGLNESRRAVLMSYIPSLQRGRNFKKLLKKEGVELFDYDESDEEVMFKFLASDIEVVADIMKAKTSGASISPFSTKNLPKSDIKLPDEEMKKYKDITSKLDRSNMLMIKSINASFMDDVLAKKLRPPRTRKPYDYKTEQRKLMLSRDLKAYIWYKGMWEEYISFLSNEIENRIA